VLKVAQARRLKQLEKENARLKRLVGELAAGALARHQPRQGLQEFQRRHPEVRGAVAPRALQLQQDVTRRIFLEPLMGDRGAGDVAAQAFEFFALMGATAHPRVQAEVVRLGAQACGGFVVPTRHRSQAQHLLP